MVITHMDKYIIKWEIDNGEEWYMTSETLEFPCLHDAYTYANDRANTLTLGEVVCQVLSVSTVPVPDYHLLDKLDEFIFEEYM